MRSFTLARALVDAGCEVTFRGAGLTDELRHGAPGVRHVELDAPGGSGDDGAATAALGPDLVVVDGYHFSAQFFAELEREHVRYAVIDDNAETHARRPVAVINQNPHSTPEMYTHLGGEPELLLGLDFAMIRAGVLDVAAQHLERVPGAVFVAMGGSDPAGLTMPIVTALADEVEEIWVACGPAMVDRDRVVAATTSLRGVRVVEQCEFLPSLARCEVAVLAAGSSLWEAAALGTNVVGIVVAVNQESAARHAVRVLADATEVRREPSIIVRLVDEARRSSPSSTATVDGRGAARLAARLTAMLEDRER